MDSHNKRKSRQGEQRILSRTLLCVILMVFSATTALAASSIASTDVQCDGESIRVASISSDPYAIIELAGVSVENGDSVVLDGFEHGEENSTISVIKPHKVTVKVGTKSKGTFLVAGTVGDALAQAGVTLKKYDSVRPGKDSLITKDMTVTVTRAFSVTLTADGKTKDCAVSGGTVAQLLKREGIKLSEYDELNVKKSTKLQKGMEITVSRVTYKDESETCTEPYTLKKEYSDELYIGQVQLKQEGVNGERLNCYLTKVTDGVEGERQLAVSLVTKEPVSRILVYGTKRYSAAVSPNAQVISELAPTVEIELDENGKPKNYKKLIVGKATAYCGGGITATGQRAMPGRVAVNPRQIPYGTKMYIVSSDGRYVYGYCEASDTGGFARKGSATVDLYMHSYDACMQFGRRYVEIYILE